MGFINVFQKMIELFLVILVGYYACKKKILDKEARLKLTNIVLNITLPAMILSSVMTQDSLPDVGEILQLLLVAAASYVLLFFSAFLFPRILRVPVSKRGVYQFMLSFGNVGFIGFPVTQAIFGDSAIFYTSVFNLPFNILVYSVGVGFIQKSASEGAKAERIEKKAGFSAKTFFSPCMIASYVSLLMALCHVRVPQLIGNTCTMLGNITTPAALLIIGSSLAEMKFQEMFGNVRVYLFTIIRLLIIPLITYGIFSPFLSNQLVLGITVIISAMPVATNGTMLCLQYHGDEKLMVQGTFLTTLGSIFTIPLLSLLFH